MAKFSLIPFNQESAPAISIEAELNETNESIFISYRVLEKKAIVDFGSGTPHKERLIKLWEKTCFELFIKNSNDQYIEFNFSPTFEWNCFYFNKKGDALKEWDQMQRPLTDILLSKEHFLLIAEIKKNYFPKGFFDNKKENSLTCAITTVIKENSGLLSYWALSHEDTRPNFHHFDSFKYKF